MSDPFKQVGNQLEAVSLHDVPEDDDWKAVLARVLAIVDAQNVHPTYLKMNGPHRPISSLTDAELKAERVAVGAVTGREVARAELSVAPLTDDLDK